MDALFALSALLAALVGLAVASLAVGVDSRDGFRDDRPNPTLFDRGHDGRTTLTRPR